MHGVSGVSFNAHDLQASKGMQNYKLHHKKRSFPKDIDMHVKRNLNVYGEYDNNSNRFISFYNSFHTKDAVKFNRNPETIFEEMARKSHTKFDY